MEVCRIQFKTAGKKYYFSPGKHKVKDGSKVVVETSRGLELGVVCGEVMHCPTSVETEIKKILRLANNNDIENHEKNLILETEAKAKVKRRIRKHKLDMKLLGCEFTLDKSKLIVYFESEQRVDFRNLVKDLAEDFKVRIELKQIGSRDGAKMIGGLGPCGLIICCKTFIGEFDNVGIKMAKNQNLSLNPQKISGTCGKLLCCIKYENETYEHLRKSLPDVGDVVKTESGDAKVLSVDVLKGILKLKYFTADKFGYESVENVKFEKKVKNNQNNKNGSN